MKIAVTAKGTDLESEMDPLFGRAAYIILVETDTMEFEVLNNSENVNRLKGAGIQAATLISKKGARVLLTGHCGPNAVSTLNAANIKIASEVKGTVKEVVASFNQGNYKFSNAPTNEEQCI